MVAKLGRWCLLLFFLGAARLLGQPVDGDDFVQQGPGLDTREAVDGSVVGLQIHNTEPHAAASTNETADIEFFFDTDLVARIRIIKIDDYDPGPGEDDSAMVFETDRDGTLTEGFRLLSTGGIQLDIGAARGLGTGICFSDCDTELFEQSDDLLVFRTGGADRYEWGTGAFQSTATSGFVLAQGAGLVTLPSFSFKGDNDNGMYRIGVDNYAFSVGGVKFFELGGSQTALFEDTTATTGDTTVVIKEGAANAGNLFELHRNDGTIGWVFESDRILAAGRNAGMQIRAWGGNSTTNTLEFIPVSGYARTSGGITNHLITNATFAPPSGTTTWVDLELGPTINQTGGASGISRALYCNPTLTASADFRCIDIALGGFRLSSGGTFGTGTGISFGDGDTEIVETADDILSLTTAGTANGVEIDATGDMTVKGTGTITATNMTIAKYVYYKAAGCQDTTANTGFDLPTATTPATACDTTFDTDKVLGVLSFDDTAEEDVTDHFTLPPGFTGNIDLFGYWHGTNIVNEVRWCVQIQCVDTGETPGAFNAATCADETVNGTADRYDDFSRDNITQTGCSANDELFWRFYREAGIAGDDFVGDADLVSLRFTIRDAQ